MNYLSSKSLFVTKRWFNTNKYLVRFGLCYNKFYQSHSFIKRICNFFLGLKILLEAIKFSFIIYPYIKNTWIAAFNFLQSKKRLAGILKIYLWAFISESLCYFIKNSQYSWNFKLCKLYLFINCYNLPL